MPCKFESKFGTGRYVVLNAPTVFIVGVHFRASGQNTPPEAYYDVMKEGQITENVPEGDVSHYDDIAQKQWEERLAANAAANRAVREARPIGEDMVEDAAANEVISDFQAEAAGAAINGSENPGGEFDAAAEFSRPVEPEGGERGAEVDTSQPA